MANAIELSLSFTGNLSDRHRIDFYDVAHAMVGFQRSLALTTHLILNDEVITKAPFMKGAEILALPTEQNGWKMNVLIGTASTALALGVAPKDSLFGHLVYSAYDYLISESLGFHVNYEKSLGEQYKKEKKALQDSSVPSLQQHRFDSLIEKCDAAIREMHRPIVGQHTAAEATITAKVDGKSRTVGKPLTEETYEYMAVTSTSEKADPIAGSVSSYNLNTFKGRLFVRGEGRPIPFDVSTVARDSRSVSLLASSLATSVRRGPLADEAQVYCKAFRKTSKSGRLKGFDIIAVSGKP